MALCAYMDMNFPYQPYHSPFLFNRSGRIVVSFQVRRDTYTASRSIALMRATPAVTSRPIGKRQLGFRVFDRIQRVAKRGGERVAGYFVEESSVDELKSPRVAHLLNDGGLASGIHRFSIRSQRNRKMSTSASLVLSIFLGIVCAVTALKEGDCEVCVAVVDKFSQTLTADIKNDPKKIEAKFREFCKGTKSKENRFCYYLGGLEESATGILGELSKPLSWSMPADKICEKLKKRDAQICDLRFEKQIDLNTVNLKKLKVRDLKKILNDWEETCEGCIEKTDFIKRIEELKPKYFSSSSKKEL